MKPISLPIYKKQECPMDHERLLMKMSIKMGADSQYVRDSEQYSYGWDGLLHACRHYDSSKGAFSTYATACIRSKIYSRNNQKDVYRRKVCLKNNTQYILSLNLTDIRDILIRENNDKSVNGFYDRDDTDFFEDRKTRPPCEVLADNELAEIIKTYLFALKPRIRNAFIDYHLNDIMQKTIGEREHVSRERIRQLIVKAKEQILRSTRVSRLLEELES